MILDTRPEEAISILSDYYHVIKPRISVGVIEGRTKGVAAVYSVERREILAARREYLHSVKCVAAGPHRSRVPF